MTNRRKCSVLTMCGYNFGECANSLLMNSINAFAMLYYTEALRLPPALAGIAMSVAIFWDAISDPVMGYVSDNTRSKYGKRHPYMFVGGLVMALIFYFIWAVPAEVRGNPMMIFWYLVAMNLLLRTALTVFFVPFIALGFEICTDYEGRAKLQAIRSIFGMLANLAGPALAWSLFFRDTEGVRATDIPENFHRMGAVFTILIAAFSLLAILFTYRYRSAESTRSPSGGVATSQTRAFVREMFSVFRDPYAKWVFLFVFLVAFNMVIVSSLQVYVYVYFMRFSAVQKSIAHGSTMLGAGGGALLCAMLVHRYDKKGAVIFGGAMSIAANAVLGLAFLTGAMQADTSLALSGFTVPVGLVIFVLFHSLYWMGGGIMLPISTAMMADISELNGYKSGVQKDGMFSSAFSFMWKAAVSVSMLASGYILSGIGFVAERTEDLSRAVTWRLGAVMFCLGPAICLLALAVISKYPVTEHTISDLRKALEERTVLDPSCTAVKESLQ